ncbi:hypothetical protein EDB89DRAFT_1914460 [Lactarius sanguifluus]|nr:hypothetical protein EDB89DRAFT_1914460 [Lactarius sanguifluus]
MTKSIIYWEGGKCGVMVQPGRDQMKYWKDAQDDAEWAREVSYIGHHVTPACDLPRTVQKSLDELAPRLRLECILGFQIRAELGLNTSPGYSWVAMGLLVGILTRVILMSYK